MRTIEFEGKETRVGYEDTRLFDMEEKEEVIPIEVEESNTGIHWTKKFDLEEKNYFLFEVYTKNGRHNCRVGILKIREDSEKIDYVNVKIPEWIHDENFLCECLEA